jgi:hypothetical protein
MGIDAGLVPKKLEHGRYVAPVAERVGRVGLGIAAELHDLVAHVGEGRA